jgi:hypothetical protein
MTPPDAKVEWSLCSACCTSSLSHQEVDITLLAIILHSLDRLAQLVLLNKNKPAKLLDAESVVVSLWCCPEWVFVHIRRDLPSQLPRLLYD